MLSSAAGSGQPLPPELVPHHFDFLRPSPRPAASLSLLYQGRPHLSFRRGQARIVFQRGYLDRPIQRQEPLRYCG